MLSKLKKRWNVKSNFQLLIIFFVFSITGSTAVFARRLIFEVLHIDYSSFNIAIKIVLSILIITPTYQVLLLVYGFLLGQFDFFWQFEKKMISRFNMKRKTH